MSAPIIFGTPREAIAAVESALAGLKPPSAYTLAEAYTLVGNINCLSENNMTFPHIVLSPLLQLVE